jgi:hypothetical protein
MPNYQVSFYKDLLSANGYPFHCLQQRFMVEDAPSSASAVATAQRRFELVHHAASWRCNADSIDVLELPDRHERAEAAGAVPDHTPSPPGPGERAVVLSFLPPGTVFEPIQVVAMCKAYDKACARLHLEKRSGELREALAAIIVSVASAGNCDCEYLCETTLERIARGG